MSRVITFSRVFPSYHPKAGQPTYFVEKMHNSFNIEFRGEEFIYSIDIDDLNQLNPDLRHTDILRGFIESLKSRVYMTDKKYHTIRAGFRFKKGDMFSPRVWSGKPYNSKQITIHSDLKIENVFKIQIYPSGLILIDGEKLKTDDLSVIAANDGLDLSDLKSWFKFPCSFEGQIICWDSKIKY